MRHVPENFLYFAGYLLAAGILLPVIQKMPPAYMNDWLGWLVLPFALLPCIAVFLMRFERVESAYGYLVLTGLFAIGLAGLSKFLVWAAM